MSLDFNELVIYLQNTLGDEKEDIHEETALFSSGLVDSFTMVDLIVFVEEKSGVTFETCDLSFDNLDSISSILTFVKKKGGRVSQC